MLTLVGFGIYLGVNVFLSACYVVLLCFQSIFHLNQHRLAMTGNANTLTFTGAAAALVWLVLIKVSCVSNETACLILQPEA